uniref:NADH dehydrogenase subunit 4L n=1 Tax=Ophrygonius sp. TaxID=2897803 RepID=UPI001EDE6DD2|nr:NADH dehydrogenase subunit 4L [Ophrygonius sp.]UFK32145.1 NADH dehydrogenase subunit 4L [Ophrygonius sp.]UIN24740.1 NADH dehydrogenase subunit 4L [Ophrygonius sp.]
MLFLIFSFLFICLFIMLFNKNHLLMMLMMFEMMVMYMYISLILFLSIYSSEFYFSMIYLVMVVCESALGLSLLVSLIRLYGNDLYQSFNMLW